MMTGCIIPSAMKKGEREREREIISRISKQNTTLLQTQQSKDIDLLLLIKADCVFTENMCVPVMKCIGASTS